MSRFQRIESNSAFGDRGTMIQKVVNNDKGWHIRRMAMVKSVFGVTTIYLQEFVSRDSQEETLHRMLDAIGVSQD